MERQVRLRQSVSVKPLQNEEKPKAIPIILCYQFLERICFFAMRNGLVIYLFWEMDFTESNSVMIFHSYLILFYICSVLEVVLTYFLNDFTIGLLGNIFYCFGFGCLLYPHKIVEDSLETYKIQLNTTMHLHLLGISLIMIGAGITRPCLLSIATAQFKLINFSVGFTKFFTLSHAIGNVAAIIASILFPIFRDKIVTIQGENIFVNNIALCSLIVIATGLFGIGNMYYLTREKSSKKFICEGIDCIKSARRNKSNSNPSDTDWLDNASGKYDYQTIFKVRQTLALLLLFIPLPIIWGVYDQHASYFIHQALNMNCKISFLGYKIHAIHITAIHPILSLLIVPFNKIMFYPVLEAIAWAKPIHKGVISYILVVAGLIVATHLEYNLLQLKPDVPEENQAHFRMFNVLNCDYIVETDLKHYSQFSLGHMNMFKAVSKKIELENEVQNYLCRIKAREANHIHNQSLPKHEANHIHNQSLPEHCPEHLGELRLKKGYGMGFSIVYDTKEEVEIKCFQDDVRRAKDMIPKVRILGNTLDNKIVELINEKKSVKYTRSSLSLEKFKILSGLYEILVDNKSITLAPEIILEGGVYVLMILEKKHDHDFELYEITPPISISIWRIFPQIALLTFSEVILVTNYVQFIFDQSTLVAKPILEATLYFTMALGNFVVLLFEVGKNYDDYWRYLIFMGLIIFNMILLYCLMNRYKPATFEERRIAYMDRPKQAFAEKVVKETSYN